MSILKSILNACSYIFEISIFLYLYAFLHVIWNRVSWRKEPIQWAEFNPIRMLRNPTISKCILSAILVIGLINIVLSHLFESNEIGAFYEKSEYTEKYEATLYIGKKPVFCIATVDKWKDEGKSNYLITEVSLPYGHSEYVYGEYDIKERRAKLYFGECGWDCYITLKEPATSTSYTILENEVVSNYGLFCASKDSDTYHFQGCMFLNNIKPQNLVYFENEKEAEVIGYKICSICADRI